ncbi:MAG: MATE family efflux transporter [Aerococcaceae bacterium]|nr:MATE family efflux transporter [Aerococcaceae bacterium]
MNDMTTGSPLKKIVIFAIPLIIGNIFQLFYNMADTFIVGKTMGVEALAGIGAAGSVMFLVLGFSQGFAAGLSIPIAQAYGAKDYEKVRRSVTINWVLALSVSAVLTVLSLYALPSILAFMGTPSEIIEHTKAYLSVIFGFLLVTVLYNMLSNMMRSLGDSRTPLYFLICAAVTNIVLDYIFIGQLGMGVGGAGLATIISQALAVVLCLMSIYHKWTLLRPNFTKRNLRADEVWYHCRIAFPMAFQASIIALGAISVTMALNRLGAVAVASFSAAHKVELVVILILMSFGVAMATYVGQNFGAKQFERIKQGVRQLTILSVFMSVVFGLMMIVGGKHLVAFFVSGENAGQMLVYGETYFYMNAPFYWLLSLLFIYRYTLQGLGDSVVPTIAGFMELIMRVAASFILSGIWGFAGISIASPLAWVGAVIPLSYAYHTKKNKLATLVRL